MSKCPRESWSDDNPQNDRDEEVYDQSYNQEERGLRHDHGEGKISSTREDVEICDVYVSGVDEEYGEEYEEACGKADQGRRDSCHDDESSDYSDMADLLSSLMAIFAESETKRKQKEIRKSLGQNSTHIARILKGTLDKAKTQKVHLLAPVHGALIKETVAVDEVCFAIKALLAVWMEGNSQFIGELRAHSQRLSTTKQRSGSLKTTALATGIARKKKWMQLRSKQRGIFHVGKNIWMRESAQPLKFHPLF